LTRPADDLDAHRRTALLETLRAARLGSARHRDRGVATPEEKGV
jgi:hypothetical protein